MTKLRVDCFSISIDGYGAGPGQNLENPLGQGGMDLPGWYTSTRTFKKLLFGLDEGDTGIDNDFAAQSLENFGAWILGRNMFGPLRGDWPDDEWKGWWGPNPPYHTPVYVLTHHARPSIEMEGGTVFHFVTDGAKSALSKATKAAKKKDVRVGGGVATIREYLSAGLIDRMHLAISRPCLVRASISWLASTFENWGIAAKRLSLRPRRHTCLFTK